VALRSERRFISYSQVTTGMMVEFSYTKDSGETGTYSAIVIDPSKKGENELYMHAILIDDLSDEEIVKLATEIGQEFNFDPDARRNPLTYLQTNEAYDRYRASNIKPKRIYRTFVTNRIKMVRQILIGALE
jgi:hypothetical protein